MIRFALEGPEPWCSQVALIRCHALSRNGSTASANAHSDNGCNSGNTGSDKEEDERDPNKQVAVVEGVDGLEHGLGLLLLEEGVVVGLEDHLQQTCQ